VELKASVIIAAAGSSSRMGGSVPKQYLMLKDLPVLIRTVKAFCDVKRISRIVITVPGGDEPYVRGLLERYLPDPGIPIETVEGGASRQESVMNALDKAGGADCVLVHDGARPFVSEALIERVLDALGGGAGSVVPGVTPKSTIRTEDETLDRSRLYEVQTPQGFRTELLREAYAAGARDGFEATDDASLVERLGVRTLIVPGEYSNIKITTAEDMPEQMRTGTGYDVHRLVEGRKLMLGCVEIPYERGLLGHSDADVIAHAIADALLGAAALGDIGKIFPDSSPDTEGMPGSVLLEKTAQLLASSGFTIVGADATLVAEKPKVSPYTELMRERIAAALGIEKSAVSVKATTEEGLGFTGSGAGMACQAVATVSGRR